MRASRSRTVTVLLAFLGVSFGSSGCRRVPEGPAELDNAVPDEVPRLVVVLVVDQMRADFLDRFDDGFTGGLRRLIDEGARYVDAHQDHALTLTGAGHGTIPTGNHPRRNGIVGNSWWDRDREASVYCAADPDVEIVGRPGLAGRSPRNLESSTIGDWLRRTHPGGQVVSLSLKDRAATLMGGRAADVALWYDHADGKFVTSTFYTDVYPDWVDAFNGRSPADSYFLLGWQRLLSRKAYGVSREDDAPYEADGTRTTLPHDYSVFGRPGPGYYSALRISPFGDHLLLDLALAAVRARGLGADRVPDLLFVGASAADGVGHVFGPHSHEVQDYYLRLDRKLEAWFRDLDREVGAGRWSLVLTSDHGVQPFPEWQAEQGLDARRLPSIELIEPATEMLARAREELEIEARVELIAINGLVLQTPEGGVDDGRMRELRELMAERLRTLDIVADVFTYDELEGPTPPDRPFGELYFNSFHPRRSADLMIRLRENYLISDSRSTSHGSPYRYDTHVPLIFWGSPFATGSHDGRVRTVDLAPTLARALDVSTPEDLDGRVLDSALAR